MEGGPYHAALLVVKPFGLLVAEDRGFALLKEGRSMTQPEFLVCLECETPCYIFEWKDSKVTDILCESCGNDDPDTFLSEEDLEAMAGDRAGSDD